jgi:RNA 2',3'-cyclic 3'-phosphodiesterase
VRVFIAIPLPADIKAKLSIVQQQFRVIPSEATWVREAGFHITLKFLGEVEAARIEPINSCLLEAVHCCAPFPLTFCGVGVFPHEHSPRVLWVGVEEKTGRLRRLQREVALRLARIGFPQEDRAFAAHLTLARLKRVSQRAKFLECLKQHRDTVFGHMDVHHIELLESQLHPAGARYSTVKVVPLQASTDTSKIPHS